MRTTQMAQMADECREHTQGFNQVRMICAKSAGHVDEGDSYHHDPFHNVSWREVDASEHQLPRVVDVSATGIVTLEPLASGVVYIRPVKQRPTLGNWLKGLVFA